MQRQIMKKILSYVVSPQKIDEVCDRLFECYGTLQNICNAPVKSLKKHGSISENAAVFITLIPEVMRYARLQAFSDATLDTPEKAGEYAMAFLPATSYECLYVILLSSSKQIIKTEFLYEGDFTNVMVNTRKIIDLVFEHRAPYIVLIHTHPAHMPEPSIDDVKTTNRIIDSLKPIDCELFDHIIVSGQTYYSMKKENIL